MLVPIIRIMVSSDRGMKGNSILYANGYAPKRASRIGFQRLGLAV